MLDKDYLSSDADFAEAENYFTEKAITAEISKLTSYDRYDTVASLEADKPYPANVFKAFSQLADALTLPITTGYNRLEIQREKPAKDLRKRAVSHLWQLYRQSQKGAS